MTKRCKVAILSFLVALFLLFTVSDLFAYRGLGDAKEALGKKAPDFALKDLQGRNFKLSDHKGKPVLLIFGTTWCYYCRDEIPRFKKIYAGYAKKGLVIVNIDIQESRDRVSRFADKYELPYKVLLDETADVAENYGVRGVPTMFLIDKQGMIVCRKCPSVEPMLEKMFQER
jgi:peroxiredoxin